MNAHEALVTFSRFELLSNGKDVFDTAKRLKLPYLVLSSVASADKNSGVPHFDSKFAIEKHLAASGIPHAIIQPAMFYDNLPKTPEPLGFWKTAIPTQSIQSKLQLTLSSYPSQFTIRANVRTFWRLKWLHAATSDISQPRLSPSATSTRAGPLLSLLTNNRSTTLLKLIRKSKALVPIPPHCLRKHSSLPARI